MNYELGIKNKRRIIINIDTASNLEVMIGLEIDGKKDMIHEKIDKQKAQVVLPLLEKLLKKHKRELSDITDIEVNEGPGSFTGLRVGVSIANALAYTLKIPVNNKKIGLFVEPRY